MSLNNLSGHALTLTSTGQTGTSGSNWSLSGNTITVTGNADINVSVINSHLSGNSLTITGASTISQNAAISWSTNQTLTLKATGNITINNTITATGSAAGLNLYYGGSDESTAPTAGTVYTIVQRSRSKIQLSGLNPQLRIGNISYTVYNSLSALSTAMASSTGATRAAMGSDITLSQTYSTSVFDISFQGIFDGLGNVIDGLIIRNSGGVSTKNNLGLFSQFQGATVRNLGITNIDIQTSSTAAGTTGSEFRIGGLVGNVGNSSLSSGYSNTAYTTTIEGVWSSGNISTANNFGTDNSSTGDRQKFCFAGGLVGSHNNGTMNLSRTYSTVNVSTAGSYTDNLAIGGLVGDIGININVSSPHIVATSSQVVCSVNKSFTTGSSISGSYGGYYGTGGVIGVVFTTGCTFEDCYSWGSAVSSASFGGLIGHAETGGTFRRVYTTQSTVGSGAIASASDKYTSVTSTSPTSGTTLPTGFGSTEWSKANNERPILVDLETAPTPLYVKVTTGGSSNFGNLNISYTIVDASGNSINLNSLGLSTPTGTPVFTITNITPAGIYNDVSYITGLTLTGSNAALYTLKPYPTIATTSHTITCPGTCNTYTISYNGNSNTGGAAPSVTTFATSGTIAAKGTLVRYGYVFTGWNTAADGSGTNYTEGGTYSSAANLTLYAKWRKAPYQVCTFTELTDAITASTDGDTISVNCNIVATAQTTISKTLVINGNGYTIQVTVPGLNDMGEFNTSASSYRLFLMNGAGKTVTVNNWTLKGGTVNGNGGAVLINSGTTMKFNNSTFSNSRAGTSFVCCSGGGGAVSNSGVLYMNNSFFKRNCAQFGGALLNDGGTTFVESSTMVENRNISSAGGGGAVENKNGGTMYFNNSTLSNNQSEIVGGAINVYGGTVYFINSSATGNVVYGNSSNVGGSISNNGGTVYIVNSLLAYNYTRNNGTVSNPTGFTLDDIVPSSNAPGVHLINSIYHANLPVSIGTNSNNIQYTGAADGSNNTIFSGGISSKITDYQGIEIGTATVYRPFLFSRNGSIAPTLKSGSFVAQSGNKGRRTRFANNNNVNPVVAYWNGSSYVNVTGTSASGQEVLVDQKGDSRPDPPSRGALESYVENLYYVKVNSATGGTVTGGSTYGEIYLSGSSVTLTATPATGYYFFQWNWVLGGSGSFTTNPYTFTATQNVHLTPVFAALPAGEFSVTYAGNNHSSGTVPSGGRFSSAHTIASAGNMDRDGYVFTGWNTAANGSGTSYSPNSTYSTANSSLTLHAQWSEISWVGTNSSSRTIGSNWSTNQVPATGSSFSISAQATRNLVLTSDITPAKITFRGGGKHIETGNFTITAGMVENGDANNHVKTTGTGRLKMNVASGASTLFPVGNSAYNPVTITNKNASADDFSVLVVDEVYENGSSSGTVMTQPHVKRTWNINKTNANSGSGVDFVFNWNSGEVTGTITTPKLFHYGTNWVKQAGTPTTTSTSLTYTGYTGSFSPFALGDDIQPLPVTMLYFKCYSNENNGNILKWGTVSESNSRYFEIQKSLDGKIYTTIGRVSAAGFSHTIRHYTFNDNQISENLVFYRLKIVDEDGLIKYSEHCVLVARERVSKTIRIYPNPSQGSFTIESENAGTYRIMDAAGRQVQSGDIIGKRIVSGILPGVYVVSILTENESYTQKVVVE